MNLTVTTTARTGAIVAIADGAEPYATLHDPRTGAVLAEVSASRDGYWHIAFECRGTCVDSERVSRAMPVEYAVLCAIDRLHA